MTEVEWLTTTNPLRMEEYLRDKASERKLRLIAVACCRRVIHAMPERQSRDAVQVAERFADGLAGNDELFRAQAAAYAAASIKENYYAPELAAYGAVDSDIRAQFSTSTGNAATVANRIGLNPDRPECYKQCDLFRCILGNLFRPASLDPAWRTPTVLSLAQAAYDERHFPDGALDPTRLAVVADALEEAGAAAELLEHLRGPGPHVRGCWAVDAALGRE